MNIIDKILKFLYVSLFLITPLIFAFDTSELFEFNKILFIYLITIFVSFFWLLKVILAKKIFIKKTFFDWPIIIFLITQVLSTLFSIDRHTSIFGYYGRFNGGLLSTISYIILFYGFVSNINDFKFILKISLISSFLVILYAIPGKLGHDITCFLASDGKIFDNSCWSNDVLQFRPELRAFSTLGQPNWLGAYLAINFFIGLYFFIIKENTLSKFIYFSYLFLNFTFILFTRSRSALLAVVFGILLFLISYLFLIKKDFKKIFLILTFIVVVPILLFKTGIRRVDDFVDFNRIKSSIIKDNKIDKDKLKNNSQSPNHQLNITDSADIRKIVWQGAIKLGLQYPLFGTGVETFAYSYYFVRPIAHNYTSEWDFVYNKAHNEFLNYLATTGFFGLAVYLLLIISFYYLLAKKILTIKRSNKKHFDSQNQMIFLLTLAIIYLTILVTNFFGFSTTTINIFFFLIPAILIPYFKSDDLKETKILKISSSQYSAMIIVSLFFLYLLISLFFYRQADVNYNLANNYFKIQEYQKAYYYLQSALKMRSEPVYDDKYSTILALLAVLAHYQKQDKLAYELISLSKDYNEKTLITSPKNIFYLKTKAKNHYNYYQISSSKDELFDGIQALKITQKLAPTDPKIPYSLAIFYLQLANIEEDIKQKKVWQDLAVSSINQSLKLKYDYQDAIALKKEIEKIIKY